MSEPDYRLLMQTLHRAAVLSERVGDRWFTGELGVSRSHYLVLRTIADSRAPVTSQQWLADLLSLTKGAVSRHVASARDAGLLQVGPSSVSRRENALELTDAGRRLVARGRRVQSRMERGSAVRLGAREVAVTTATLQTICDLLEEAGER